jgi:predicted TIM-barrel fold metal-dependent hydrolase
MVRLRPDALIGFCFLNPLLGGSACRREIDRCVTRLGFRGLKLWVSVNCRSRKLDPIMTHAAELRVPVLHHAWYNAEGSQADESTPPDIADLAGRFPRTTIIMAHLAGVGVRGICDIAPCSNVFVDTAGGQPVAGLVEEAVARLGAGRVVYGSDMPMRDFSSQLGRIYGAGITAADRRKILGRNAANLLGID